ncbi:MAG: TRAP transporter small permease subunit [Paracoccaceae bacterium]|nr:TRAP transporter small permease subunit [Paracoccaceae bacterium]
MSEQQTLDAESGPLPHTAFSRTADAIIFRLGVIFSAVWFLLVLVIILNVVLRFGFSATKIYIEELQWHIYAVGIAFAMSFALVVDAHIRIDLLSSRFRKRTTSWIEVIGTLVFLLPYCVFVLIYCVQFVSHSFASGEVSISPGGLPYRWIIKSMLPLAFLLVAIAAISRLTRCIAYLRDARR